MHTPYLIIFLLLGRGSLSEPNTGRVFNHCVSAAVMYFYNIITWPSLSQYLSRPWIVYFWSVLFAAANKLITRTDFALW